MDRRPYLCFSFANIWFLGSAKSYKKLNASSTEINPSTAVTAADSGTSNRYEIHQNVELMTSVLPIKTDHKKLTSKIVCSIENWQCMMKQCENYSGVKELADY